MKCLYITAKNAFCPITEHCWLFLQKCFSSPLFAQMQAIKMPEIYIGHTPSVGKPKNEQEMSGSCT